jgi:hypothetical protein
VRVVTADLALPPRTHTGQATQIEQARAQAEVLAAMEAAKRWPRDEDLCENKMRRACARPQVAEKAFWAFPRGGEQLTGSTIHLAVTLAGIWGNVQYGVVELERNAQRRESQMLAVAWELESNTRATTTFLVPHQMSTKRGVKDLTDLRDVYENNANQGARRVREMIFKILPDWYTETAEDICRGVLERNDKPIEEQRAAIAKAFETLGVGVEQLSAKIGRDWDDTTPADLAILRIVGKSIRRGEATVREQFPAPGAAAVSSEAPAVTAAELTGGLAVAAPPAAAEAAPEAPSAPADGPARTRPPARGGPRGMNRLFGLLDEAGMSEEADRHQYASRVLDREVTTFKQLTAADVEALIANLEAILTDDPTTESETQ